MSLPKPKDCPKSFNNSSVGPIKCSGPSCAWWVEYHEEDMEPGDPKGDCAVVVIAYNGNRDQ